MIHNLDYKFTFGKHKDERLKHVIETDINYIVWCLNDIPDFFLTNDAKLHFIDHKDKINPNHSRIDQSHLTAVLSNNASEEEFKKLWNISVAKILNSKDEV